MRPAGFKRTARGALAAAAAVAFANPALSADFYQGKTITIVVGSDVGGGFDAFARLLARHLGAAIPGHPAVVVENRPGAGSGAAAAYVYAAAPKDGTVVGALVPGGLLAPLFEGRGAAYDTRRFRFLGSANASSRLCLSLKASGVATFADALARRIVAGAGAVGSASFDYAYLHRNLYHANFNVVAGYKGMADILLAMDRGEAEVVCGFDWSSLRAQRADPGARFNFLTTVSVKPEPSLEALGVPEARTFADNDRDRAIGDLVAAQQVFGRPYVMAPDTPPERLALLRAAFDAALKSAALAAEAAASGMEIDSANGDAVEAAVRGMYAAPADVIEGARKAIRP